MTVVAISDKSGGIFNPNGIYVSDAIEWVRKNRLLQGCPQGEPLSNEQLLEVETDVLVPAALENVITRKNAGAIKAKVIAEGANGPVTAPADAILDAKGIFVIPDILANAGGVTVSYFEWVQGLQEYFWDEDEVYRRLERILIRAYDEVTHTMEVYGVDMRNAAQITAINRVAQATLTRGFYP
jgi:glutamate dehydrogenase (NAD(P)+)